MISSRNNLIGRLPLALAALALVAALIASCAQLEEAFAPSAPGVGDDWAAILKQIRAFERGIGFKDTGNFTTVSDTDEQHALCGYAPHFRLPYSYEDPAILWRDAVSEQECLEFNDGGDVSYGVVEALGEVNAPLTPSILAGPVDRFVYLVFHEDCHDQFELPYGIEEALCDLIAYQAMPLVAAQMFGRGTPALSAVQRYARLESQRTYATIQLYARLEVLYARLHRHEVTTETTFDERAQIFAEAERVLGRKAGTMNNVAIANDMTYSRHYPYLESVFAALGRDLARTVAFFKHVDKIKPSGAAVMKRRKIGDEQSVEFIRAYEEAVLDATAKALAELKAARAASS